MAARGCRRSAGRARVIRTRGRDMNPTPFRTMVRRLRPPGPSQTSSRSGTPRRPAPGPWQALPGPFPWPPGSISNASGTGRSGIPPPERESARRADTGSAGDGGRPGSVNRLPRRRKPRAGRTGDRDAPAKVRCPGASPQGEAVVGLVAGGACTARDLPRDSLPVIRGLRVPEAGLYPRQRRHEQRLSGFVRQIRQPLTAQNPRPRSGMPRLPDGASRPASWPPRGSRSPARWRCRSLKPLKSSRSSRHRAKGAPGRPRTAPCPRGQRCRCLRL